ncbi:ankyrin-2 isoform X2 [Nasonia vitripennis]|uniref:Uncharacterized protein n=1 Tax=Nasonia vitripennis TaxID=7425 RepID=A0A7M7QFD3_NASVI|nr:ankyrin-2 isoform X2 [Nasonia vitripennis]
MQGNKFPSHAKGRQNRIGKKKFFVRRDDIDELVALLQNDPEKVQIEEVFYKAVTNMDLQMVSALLSNGVKIENLNDSNQTAVHRAFALDHPGLVELLLRHWDKKVNLTDETGLSHFHIACIAGLHGLVLEFIKSGVDVNLRVGSDGPTPLQLAVNHVRPEVAKQLLQHGADSSVTDEADRTLLHIACGIHESIGEVILSEKFKSIESKAKEIIAIKQKTTRIVQHLIQSGSSVDARDRYGESPLFHVFRDDTHEYTAQKFSRSSLDYQIHKDNFRRTKLAMITSLRMGQHENLNLLLSHKADVRIRSYETGDTILHRAVKDLQTLRDPRVFGEPIFHDVAHARMIDEILKRGLDVNAKNRRGETALMIAASVLSSNVVSVLLNHGAKSRDIRFDDGFRYPGILPSLEAVHNFLEVAARRSDSLSKTESLAVVRFLVDNNAECKYADPEDEDAGKKLRNLLEFGTDEKVISTLQKITKDDGYSRGVVNDQINRVTRLADTPDIPHREFNEFKAEAEKMRATRLASGRSLMSILTAPAAEVSSFVKRGEHKEILYSRYLDFEESFRHNWGIVRGFFAKFLIRRSLVRVLNDHMRFVAAKPLPDHCCERIAVYLSNEDLMRLCVASTAEAPRRETEACTLADKLSSSLGVV